MGNVDLSKKHCGRKEKGKEIALKSDLIRVSDYHYHVHSQTTNRDYDVIKVGEVWSCTCPDHKFRHVCCKHIHAVEFSLKVRDEVRKERAVIIEPVNPSRCTQCKSSDIVKHGIRHNKCEPIKEEPSQYSDKVTFFKKC